MSVEAIGTEIINRRISKFAEEIKVDMVGVAQAHKVSGAGARAIRIEKLGVATWFVGAHINWGNPDDGGLHLFYLDEGNGGRSRIIVPKRSKALNTPYGWKAFVHGYPGIGFVHAVASRHRI